MSRFAHPGAPVDLLFPQMASPEFAHPRWRPGFADYLYMSLTNATAFSPTDTMPLTHTAKAVMGVQSVTALLTVGLVVARAVKHPGLRAGRTARASVRAVSPRILVVDDDPDVRRMLARTLTAEGHEVEAVPDGGAALAAAERRAPDTVLLDVSMPGLDGLAVCCRLRAAGLAVPILLLTARDAVADRVAGLEAAPTTT